MGLLKTSCPEESGEPMSEPVPNFPRSELTPELLEWARKQINEEEIVAALREMQETGGLELSEFLDDLKRAAGIDE
jgi:hypothetical protein